jgi:hypothetical protein
MCVSVFLRPLSPASHSNIVAQTLLRKFPPRVSARGRSLVHLLMDILFLAPAKTQEKVASPVAALDSDCCRIELHDIWFTPNVIECQWPLGQIGSLHS